MILERPETICIPAKNIAIEITKQNQKLSPSLLGIHLIVTLISVCIPYILNLAFDY